MEEVLNYEGLVYSIIQKYVGRFDKDDLYQVGMIGLIDAYKHYDASQNTKFSSFAYYYILGEVRKFIRNSSSLKVSDQLIQLRGKIIKAKEVMEQKLGRDPTNLEISLMLDVDENIIDQAILATNDVESIDDDFHFVECYDDTSAEVLDLKNEIHKLSKEEKKLLYARYYQDLTQSETSDLLGISQVQVSRCEGKILKKLRTNL